MFDAVLDELLELWTKLVLELDHPSYDSCTESLNCLGQPRELTMASQRSAVLLACGSFNPPTNMHLRLFGKLSLWWNYFYFGIIHALFLELAKDYLDSKGIKVLGGIISPVNDCYPKKGLLPSSHRINMVQAAIADYEFVKCSTWEADQDKWTRTRAVLEEYKKQIAHACKDPSSKADWLPDISNDQQQPQLLLLCGGDLLETFSVPDLWKDEDVSTITNCVYLHHMQ